MEETRQHAYEAGYKAGWEDASSAHAAGQAELRAEVARNLQAMSFTYHEARGQILRAIEPLLTDIAASLLPEVARIAFLIFLPFLVIDLVVAAILMSMGMMMVPPAVVALPFKLAFFVVADGWALLSGALVRSYV